MFREVCYLCEEFLVLGVICKLAQSWDSKLLSNCTIVMDYSLFFPILMSFTEYIVYGTHLFLLFKLLVNLLHWVRNSHIARLCYSNWYLYFISANVHASFLTRLIGQRMCFVYFSSLDPTACLTAL